MPEISIIHPSRSRPKLAFKTAEKWLEAADNKDIEYILAVDESDPKRKNYDEVFKHNDTVCVMGGDSISCVEAMNASARYTTGNIIIAVSDDFDKPPQGWDTKLLTALKGKEDFVVKTQDGAQPWIITLPIMDRKYYERFGYIYHPGYKHLFCDTEMTHVGHLLGRVITLTLTILHNHYTQMGGHARDAVNERNDATWMQGEDLYLQRLESNFGLKKEELCEIDIPFHHRGWLATKGVIF